MRALFLPFLLIIGVGPVRGQYVSALDSSFAQHGILRMGTPSVAGHSRMTLTADGRIVTVHAYTYSGQPSGILYGLAVRRYLGDGTPDSSLNGTGDVRVPVGQYCTASGIRVQPDGKLVVLGSTGHYQGNNAVLLRLHPDGQPDSSFNSAGRITFQHTAQDGLFDLELQADGKIMVAGNITLANMQLIDLRRFDTLGRPDSSFGYFGVLQTALLLTPGFALRDLCIQPDGKLIITGTSMDLNITQRPRFTIARYEPEGLLDSGFHFGTGFMSHSFPGLYHCSARRTALRPDGKMIVGGWVTYRYNGAAYCTLLQLRADGRVDSSWGMNGVVVVDSALAGIMYHMPEVDVKVTANNKILVSFNHDNASGERDYSVYRLQPDGTRDLLFGQDGMVTTSLGPKSSFAEELLIQPDGKILLGGRFQLMNFLEHFGIVRYYQDRKLNVREVPPADYGLSLFPNPADASSRLLYRLVRDEIVSVGLRDASGRRVQLLQAPERREPGAHILPLRLAEGLPAGVYFVQLRTATGVQSEKLVLP